MVSSYLTWDFARELAGSILLFCLVFGMSGTVETKRIVSQLHNKKAIFTGLFLQFLIIPVLGFVVVKTMNLSHAVGITLLVITSSPGGSYSNWWCSLFNADLALSITMTGISTLLGVIMLPINLVLYASLSYGDNIVEVLNWSAVFISLAIVILAIAAGLTASQHFNSHRFHVNANRLGNVAGLLLIVFSGVLSNTDKDEQIWERDWQFYVGTALPSVAGLLIANVITSLLKLKEPERVTVSIECCYQNVGIATSVALTMFDGDELSEAMGVPFFFGLVEAAVVGVYCLIAWKANWTLAPSNAPIWTVLLTSYEVIQAEKQDGSSTELTAATSKDKEDSGSDEEDGFHYVKATEEDFQPPEEKDAFHYVQHGEAAEQQAPENSDHTWTSI